MEMPEEYINVMITYKGKVLVRDKYYGHYEDQIVTRRAFFSKSDGYYNGEDEWINTPNGIFHVPQFWQEFTWSNGQVSLLPHTFYTYGKVLPENIINWKYDKQ